MCDVVLAGAVTARLRIFDTGLSLVVAHLSSGEADGDELRRNYDYSEIMRRCYALCVYVYPVMNLDEWHHATHTLLTTMAGMTGAIIDVPNRQAALVQGGFPSRQCHVTGP